MGRNQLVPMCGVTRMIRTVDNGMLRELADMAGQITVPDWLVHLPGGDAVYYRFLYLLSKQMGPRLAVELGTREGVGALALAEGGAHRVVSVDVDLSRVQEACAHPRIEFRKHDSLSVDPDLDDVDILFIDTDKDAVHYGDQARREYDAWASRISEGGVVLFDDITINGSMKDFWREFHPTHGVRVELPVHGDCGFGAVIL